MQVSVGGGEEGRVKVEIEIETETEVEVEIGRLRV